MDRDWAGPSRLAWQEILALGSELSNRLELPPLHIGLRVVAGVVSAAIGVSSIAQGIAAMRGEQVLWLAVGFGAVGTLASVLGVLTGLGKFRSGPALSLACVGGTIQCQGAIGPTQSSDECGDDTN